MSKDSEFRGQALFNLGLIYHFGSSSNFVTQSPLPGHQSDIHSHSGVESEENNIEINLSHAQKFYNKALKEESKAQAPVYLLYLYSKW